MTKQDIELVMEHRDWLEASALDVSDEAVVAALDALLAAVGQGDDS